MDGTTTKYPVVFIHGVFGYGSTRPLWNTWCPYWPEQALHTMNPTHVLLQVGVLSSDHDRACEAFYQLYGGRVDYGQAHSHDARHKRFGGTHATPLHPTWSAAHPIHLVGHSFGSTTALELYQLLCADFFHKGTDHRWVQSLVAIAGPLSGSTLPHLLGLHEPRVEPYSLGHVVGSALCLWFKLQTDVPLLRHVFDFRMPQWENITSVRELLSTSGRIHRSRDLAVFDILPKERMQRNAQLRDMDKLYLVSVITSSHVRMPYLELALGTLVLVFGLASTLCARPNAMALTTLARGSFLATLWSLSRRARMLDYASMPSFYALVVLMRRHVRMLHMIFDGFDRDVWSENDGAVNLHSMLRPWATTRDRVKASSALTSTAFPPLETGTATVASRTVAEKVEKETLDPLDVTKPVHAFKLRRGEWYVHRVQKNHMAGTHFDSDAPAFYQRLFQVMTHHFERDAMSSSHAMSSSPPSCFSRTKSSENTPS